VVAVDLRATVQSVAAVYDRRTDLPSSEAAVGPADGSNPRALPSEVAVDPPNEAAVYDRRTDLPSSEAAVGPADGSNPRALPSEVAVDLRATGDKNYSSGGPVTDAPAIRAEDNTAIIPEPTPSPAPEAQETVPAEPVTEQSAPPHSETANGNTSAHPSPRIDTPETFAIRWGMPQKLTWKDADEIAYALIDAHPDQDPLKLSFPKLHKLIIELADFGDDPEKSTESILESIQMAWYEEVK
jgi:FeS assembly protein IscX